MGIIKTRGYAERMVKADATEFTITFESKELNAENAVRIMECSCEKFLDGIKEVINLEDISVTNDRTYQNIYDKVKYFSASRTICFKTLASVRMNNFVNSIIKKNNIKADISMNNLFSKKLEISKELLAEAVKKAKQDADIIASATNQRVLGINKVCFEREMDEDNIYDVSPRLYSFMPTSNMLSDELSVNEITVSEEVFVTWNIE